MPQLLHRGSNDLVRDSLNCDSRAIRSANDSMGLLPLPIPQGLPQIRPRCCEIHRAVCCQSDREDRQVAAGQIALACQGQDLGP